jgi:arylsulfatase A-like enzyme
MDKSKTSRRQFLKGVGSATALLMAGGCNRRYLSVPRLGNLQIFKKDRKERPNILFITTDCQRASDGTSLGSPFLDMPALDRLCREGVVFKKHYSNAPACRPARYTWITGTFPHTHGKWDDSDGWLPANLPVLMECLKSAGYYTIGVGKMLFSPWDRMAGFRRRIIADGKGTGKADNELKDDYAKFLAAYGLTRWDYLKQQKPGDMEIFGVFDWPFDPSLHIDAFVGGYAKTVIEKKELKKPFFLWVSFNGPHNPWDAPIEYSAKYKNIELPGAETFEGELETKPIDHTRLRNDYMKAVVDRIDGDPEHKKQIIHRIRAGHFGGLTFIDRQVEGILRALEKKKLLDRTIIIYSSDHGCHLGDHNLIYEGTHYDCCARVPFVIRYPKLFKPGVVRVLSCHTDLMPTVLSLAGAGIPTTVEGKDLTPLLTGRAESIWDSALIEILSNTSIVTDRWKMGVYPRDGDGDLYDLRDDPNELHNLYKKAEYAEIQNGLLRRILATNPKLTQNP